MCLAHFCDQVGFSRTRPGIPFAARWAFRAARTVFGVALLPAAAAPATASATTTRLRRVDRIADCLIGARRRWLYGAIRQGAHRPLQAPEWVEQARAI